MQVVTSGLQIARAIQIWGNNTNMYTDEQAPSIKLRQMFPFQESFDQMNLLMMNLSNDFP